MAIRKAGGPKTVKRTRSTEKVDAQKIDRQQGSVGPSPAPNKSVEKAVADIRADLKKATAPGVGRSQWLSQAEVKGLIDQATAAGPEATTALKSDLAAAMTSGQIAGNDLKLGHAALKAVAQFTDVAAGTYRTAAQNKDGVAEHDLAEGLAKHKTDVSQADVVATKNQIDELKVQGQTGSAVSKEEFTPQYKAAKLIGDEIKTASKAHLDENHPAAAAAADAISPIMNRMINKTAVNLSRNPAATARVAHAFATVGQQGFSKAVSEAGPHVAKAFTEATGVQAMNPHVVGSLLEKIPKAAEKFAPALAPKLTEVSVKLAKKLGLEVAEAGAKAGAKVGTKGAASASKTVPGLGNMVSAGCAILSAVGLVKSLFAKPRDGETIAKNGLNTLLQTVGIAFPWVGLAGDVVDIGWSAKKGVTDAKAGKEPEQGISKQDAAALVGGPARLLASVLSGAGQGGTAKAFEDLANVTEQAAGAKTIERHQVNAFSQLSQVASNEVGKAAAAEDDPHVRDALNTVAHGFGETFKVLYQHKKMKPEDSQKRGDLQAQLARVGGDVAMGVAAMHIGGKDAKLDVIDDLFEQQQVRQQQDQDATVADQPA